MSLEAGLHWDAYPSSKNLRTYVFIERTRTEYQGSTWRPTWHRWRLIIRDCPNRWVIKGHPLFVTRRGLVEWRDSKTCQILRANSIIIGSIGRSLPNVIRRCDNNTKSKTLDEITFSLLNQEIRLRKVYLIAVLGVRCVDNYWRKAT